MLCSVGAWCVMTTVGPAKGLANSASSQRVLVANNRVVSSGVSKGASAAAAERTRWKSNMNSLDLRMASAILSPAPLALKSVHIVLPRKRTPPSTNALSSSRCTCVPSNSR